MKNSKKIIVLSLFSLFAVTLLIVTTTLRGQNQKPSTAGAQKESPVEGLPVSDYGAAAEPDDPGRRAARQMRGKHFNSHLSNPNDLRRFEINEETQSAYGLPPSHMPPEPALPAALSDAVIIGEVTDARSYLSPDKTDLYSEFTVRVDTLLKNTAPTPLFPGATVAALRSGGGVRFPSGKVVERAAHGKAYPQSGRRYVLFLKYLADGQGFNIVTGYELRGGRVVPLDGADKGGMVVDEYAAYQKFKGEEETAFLGQVREAIARDSQISPKGGK